MSRKAHQLLAEASSTYKAKNATYGDNYLRVGNALAALFPEGVTLKTPDDFNRFHIFALMVVKQSRYCVNWNSGGHQDSVHDNTVYSAILEEIDEAIAEKDDLIEKERSSTPDLGLLTDEDLEEVAKDFRGTGQKRDPEPTHYVWYNGASHFVKVAGLFVEQNGMTEPWGKNWRPVVATSIANARDQSKAMDWGKPVVGEDMP